VCEKFAEHFNVLFFVCFILIPLILLFTLTTQEEEVNLWDKPKHKRWLPVTCGNKKALIDRVALSHSKLPSLFKCFKAAATYHSQSHHSMNIIKIQSFIVLLYNLSSFVLTST